MRAHDSSRCRCGRDGAWVIWPGFTILSLVFCGDHWDGSDKYAIRPAMDGERCMAPCADCVNKFRKDLLKGLK